MNYVLWRTVLSSFCLYGIGLHAFLVSLCVWASTALYMCIFLTVGETCICSFTLDLLHYATGFRQLQFVSIWSRDLLSEYINRLLPSTLLDQQEFFMVNTSSSFFVLLFCFCFVFFSKNYLHPAGYVEASMPARGYIWKDQARFGWCRCASICTRSSSHASFSMSLLCRLRFRSVRGGFRRKLRVATCTKWLDFFLATNIALVRLIILSNNLVITISK